MKSFVQVFLADFFLPDFRFFSLVKILRRVNGDKILFMVYVYGDLLTAKKKITEAFRDDRKKYFHI